MNKDFYVEKENWYGSYYELAIEFQSSHDNIRLENALQTLWSHPNLNGRWLSKDHYGQAPDTFRIADEFIVADHNSLMYLYGEFFVPEIERQVGCLSIVVREKDGSDWLDFCIPTGMLVDAFSVKHPPDMREYPWAKILDKYLLQMADMIYQQTPFDLAFIGDEVSGLVNKASIISEGIENQIKFYGLNKNKIFLSPVFWNEISLDKTYEVLPSGLRWTTFA